MELLSVGRAPRGRALYSLVAVGLAVAAALPAGAQDAPADPAVVKLVETLGRELDRTPPDVFVALGESKSPVALEALVERLDGGLNGLLPRARAVRELPDFVGEAELEKAAFEAMLKAATKAEERGLRLEAVDALASCGSVGRLYLAIVVDYSDDPRTRARALEHHGEYIDEESIPWYEELFDSPARRSLVSPRPEDGEIQPVDDTLRLLAFEALLPSLDDDEVFDALSDKAGPIRSRALEVLAERGHPKAVEQATERWQRSSGSREERLVAAEIFAAAGGDKACEELVTFGSRRSTSWDGRLALAEAVAKHATPVLLNRLYKPLGKGEIAEQLFSLQTLAHTASDKLAGELRKLLKSESMTLRRETVRVLGERGDPDSFKHLKVALKKVENLGERAGIIKAMDATAADADDWIDELRKLVEHDSPEVRGAAMAALMTRDVEGNRDVLERALASGDWSLVRVALEAIEGRRQVEDIGLLIDLLPGLDGRAMRETTGVLWRLTGQDFRQRSDVWAKWWADAGEDLVVLDERDSALLEEEVLHRAKTADTQASFFGIQVHTSRVIFVIDTSGSMMEKTSWASEDADGGGRDRGYGDGQRMDIAKVELNRCLERLEPGSLFNIISFSDVIRPWSKDLRRGQKAGLARAQKYVDGLEASGGTNVFDALKTAFEDVDVDTIFVLSDGEPTAGAVRDPGSIRRLVQSWNEQRQIRLHCIAIGGSLKLLEQLAKDSGGEYMEVR